MSRSAQDQHGETLLPLSWLKFAISAKAWHIRQTDHAEHLSMVRRPEASPADRRWACVFLMELDDERYHERRRQTRTAVQAQNRHRDGHRVGATDWFLLEAH
jgi:hypothetical protein